MSSQVELEAHLFSEAKKDNGYAVFEDYVVWAMRNTVDEDSEFGRKSKPLRDAGEAAIRGSLAGLLGQGHDMMLSVSEGKVAGHISFQRYQENGVPGYQATDSWEVFQHFRKDGYGGRGFGYSQALKLIELAKERGVKRIRVGGDSKHPKVQRIVDRLKTDEEILGISVDADLYWVELNQE